MFKLSFSNIPQWVLTGFILYQIIFIWVPLWRSATQLEGVDVSNILIENEQGKSIPLSHFKGETLIINFWATWCLSCRIAVINKDGKVESITYGFRPWVQAYLLWWV